MTPEEMKAALDKIMGICEGMASRMTDLEGKMKAVEEGGKIEPVAPPEGGDKMVQAMTNGLNAMAKSISGNFAAMGKSLESIKAAMGQLATDLAEKTVKIETPNKGAGGSPEGQGADSAALRKDAEKVTINAGADAPTRKTLTAAEFSGFISKFQKANISYDDVKGEGDRVSLRRLTAAMDKAEVPTSTRIAIKHALGNALDDAA